MKVSTNLVEFRMDIDFPDCEVDMAIKEAMSAGASTPVPSILCDSAQIPIDKSKLGNTPTSASVLFTLNWLMGYVNRNTMEITESKWDKDYEAKPIKTKTEDGTEYTTWPTAKTELEEIGVEVIKIHGLMQGTCHLICSCGVDVYSPDKVKQAEKVVGEVFGRFIQYFEQPSIA